MLPHSTKIGNYDLSELCVVEYKGQQLLLPRSFAILSDEERKRICNGAGPKGYGKLVPDNLAGYDATAPSDGHDEMYHEKKDKRLADCLYLFNMAWNITKEKDLADVIQLRLAEGYTMAVHMGGQSAFDHAG